MPLIATGILSDHLVFSIPMFVASGHFSKDLRFFAAPRPFPTGGQILTAWRSRTSRAGAREQKSEVSSLDSGTAFLLLCSLFVAPGLLEYNAGGGHAPTMPVTATTLCPGHFGFGGEDR